MVFWACSSWRAFSRIGAGNKPNVVFPAGGKPERSSTAGGVPSGAGWHSIGAPTNAETIVNNYEATGILAGWAVETPYPFAGEAPFAAKDVATFRIVRHGEAFTTARGHLHWYAVDSTNPVCVTIWKHGCDNP